MPELIDRHETLRKIETLCKDYLLHEPAGMGGISAIRLCKEIVEKQPTIEPEVRHGRWIPIEYDCYSDGSPVWDKYECSECGHEHSGEEDTLTAFCPDCGADMREEVQKYD